MNARRERFIKALPTAKTAKEAAIIAGYSPHSANSMAYKLKHEDEVAQRIASLVDTGLDTLEDVATNGSVEIARVTAAKVLVETGLGKPKDNKSTTFGDITINVAKIDPSMIQALKG